VKRLASQLLREDLVVLTVAVEAERFCGALR